MTTINGIEFEDYFAETVSLDPARLQGEFTTTPAALAYFGERAANALRRRLQAKVDRERGEAEAWLRHKAMLDTGYGKGPTVKDIESAVAVDDTVHALKVEEVEAEAAYLAERNRYNAVAAKKDVLQSLGAMVRVEMERDPLTRMPNRGRSGFDES